MSALREIIAKFGIKFDDAELKKGLASIEGGIGLFKKFAGAAGIGLSLAALKDFVTATNDQVIALDKQSRYLRVGMEDLQRWQQAAQIAGTSTEALNGLFETMRMRTRKPTEGILQLSDKLAAIKDPTKRAQLGTMMLGNSYRELEPLLEKGRKGIKGLLAETEDLAVVFGKDSVAAAKDNRSNWARLSIIWNGLGTMLGSFLLPIVAKLSAAIVPIAVWLKNITKHTQLFRAAAMLLGGGGLFMLVRRFGSLGGVLKAALPFLRAFSKQLFTTALAAAKVVLPLLLLEDFLVFLGGGKSAFGEILDKVFGKGTAERVRAWVAGAIDSFSKFINQVKTAPAEAVQTLLEWFEIDPTSEWKVFFRAFVDTLNFVIRAFTGGWDGAKKAFSDTWDAIVVAAEIGWSEIEMGFVHLAAMVGDAFSSMWASVVRGAGGVVGFLGKAAEALGASDTAKSLLETASDLGKSEGSNNAALVEQARDAERLRLAEKADAVGKGIASSQTTNNSPTINVTVPPGTPEQTAKRIADETAKQLRNKNQATRAALVPGQG